MEEEFFNYIMKGEFRIPVCNSCRKKLWPPSQYCSACLSKTHFKKIRAEGILVEFSFSHMRDAEGAFGIVDLYGIRLIGSISGWPLRVGMKVKMAECGIRPDGKVYYRFKKADQNKNA
jgi:uncharacterized OB-fold protein